MDDAGQHAPEQTTIHYRTMARAVADFLRSAILSGRFAPGDRIEQDDLAHELDVSRMPVREALRILQSEGLLLLRPHRAAIVVSLRAEDIAEIFEIRALLEGRAAELAAPQLSTASLQRLREIYQEMDGLLDNWDHDRWLHLNREFHMATYPAEGWERLRTLIGTQQNTIFPYQRAATGLISRRAVAHQEHYQILLAAESRDSKLIGNLTAEHLRSTARDLIGYVSIHRARAPGS